jgi:hypothetical protein
MNQEAIENGKTAVETLRDTNLPPILRVQGLNSLDSEGYYKFAVEQGLHQAVLGVLKENLECAMERFTKKNPMENVVYLHWMVNTIFRGQRISRAGTSTFGKLDGGQIKAFIESDPEVFPTWWKAAVLIARVPLHRKTSPDVQLLIHHQAIRCLGGLCDVLMQQSCESSGALGGGSQKVQRASGVDVEGAQSGLH